MIFILFYFYFALLINLEVGSKRRWYCCTCIWKRGSCYQFHYQQNLPSICTLASQYYFHNYLTNSITLHTNASNTNSTPRFNPSIPIFIFLHDVLIIYSRRIPLLPTWYKPRMLLIHNPITTGKARPRPRQGTRIRRDTCRIHRQVGLARRFINEAARTDVAAKGLHTPLPHPRNLRHQQIAKLMAMATAEPLGKQFRRARASRDGPGLAPEVDPAKGRLELQLRLGVVAAAAVSPDIGRADDSAPRHFDDAVAHLGGAVAAEICAHCQYLRGVDEMVVQLLGALLAAAIANVS